ncbi:hypothetical protein [Euzebya sp.]|uniref:hypothetical protein n=1 Tax=Euzebya sp. TaxID=1971409 RepID=UPI003516BC24
MISSWARSLDLAIRPDSTPSSNAAATFGVLSMQAMLAWMERPVRWFEPIRTFAEDEELPPREPVVDVPSRSR